MTESRDYFPLSVKILSVEYEKDVFAFFVERVELPHLTCNSKTILQEKISLIFNIRQFVFSKKFVE